VCISSTDNVPFEKVDDGGCKLWRVELWFFVAVSIAAVVFVVLDMMVLIVWFDIDDVFVVVVSGQLLAFWSLM
jgi:hypothetical protein